MDINAKEIHPFHDRIFCGSENNPIVEPINEIFTIIQDRNKSFKKLLKDSKRLILITSMTVPFAAIMFISIRNNEFFSSDTAVSSFLWLAKFMIMMLTFVLICQMVVILILNYFEEKKTETIKIFSKWCFA